MLNTFTFIKQEKKHIDIRHVLGMHVCKVINSGDVSFPETGLSSQKLLSGLVH